MKAAIEYPTLEELQQYHEGTLNAMRSHELEYLSLHDPAVADAMEGYAIVPSFGPLPPASVLFASSTATTTIVAKSWWHLNGWIVALISGISIVVAIIIGLNNGETKALTITNTAASQRQIGHVHSGDYSNLDQFAITDNNSQLNEISMEVSNVETIAPVEAQTINNSVSENPSASSSVTMTENNVAEEPNKYKYVGVDSKYINNHEVLDYSEILASNFPHVSLILEQTNTDQNNTLSYLTFLKEAIALLDSKKYTQAIIVFQWLSDHHKNDVNALFFHAMSAYESGDYVSAEKGFAKAAAASAPVHKEQARFYRAKSFVAINNTEEAKSLFEKIIVGNGKYAADATKELQELLK
jgi:TolA-binding protein